METDPECVGSEVSEEDVEIATIRRKLEPMDRDDQKPGFIPLPPPSFEVAAVCLGIRIFAVVVEVLMPRGNLRRTSRDGFKGPPLCFSHLDSVCAKLSEGHICSKSSIMRVSA